MDAGIAVATPTQIKLHREAQERRAKFFSPAARQQIITVERNPENLTLPQIIDYIKRLNDVPGAVLEIRRALTPETKRETTPGTIGDIKSAVCQVWHVRERDLIASSRALRFIAPRHVAMALCRYLTTRSLPQIGAQFGDRDHVTVLHAVRRATPALDNVAARLSPDAPAIEWAAAMKEELLVTPFAANRSARPRLAGSAPVMIRKHRVSKNEDARNDRA